MHLRVVFRPLVMLELISLQMDNEAVRCAIVILAHFFIGPRCDEIFKFRHLVSGWEQDVGFFGLDAARVSRKQTFVPDRAEM